MLLVPRRNARAQMVGLGQLGKEGTGRLRLQVRTQKQKLSAKAQKKAKAYGGGGPSISGLSSSLAFTPVQVSARCRSMCNDLGYDEVISRAVSRGSVNGLCAAVSAFSTCARCKGGSCSRSCSVAASIRLHVIVVED